MALNSVYTLSKSTIRAKFNKYLFVFILMFWLLHTFLVFKGGIKAYKNTSANMEPTISLGDKVLAKKILPSQIKRGMVVVYLNDSNTPVVGRVFGLANDIVSINSSGRLVLNSDLVEIETGQLSKNLMEYLKIKNKKTSDLSIAVSQDLNYSIVYNKNELLSLVSDMDLQNYPYKVPQNKLFIVGDHRSNSLDSRLIGAINIEKVNYSVKWVYYSPKSTSFLNINFDKIFTPLY